MEIPTLTEEEFNSIVSIQFTDDEEYTREENDEWQTFLAKKIMAILINYTIIVYPPDVQAEIEQKSKLIKDNELKIILKDNNVTD